MDRRLMTAPEQIPQGDIDPTQEMVGLEEVEALSLNKTIVIEPALGYPLELVGAFV